MTRHQMRESAFLLVFERLFSADPLQDTLDLARENESVPLNQQVESLLRGVEEHQAELDQLIEQHLHHWKFSRISKVSLAVLRVALYELRYDDDLVDDIVISEAVKIAQDYTSKEDVAFINGLLSAVVKGSDSVVIPADSPALIEEQPSLEHSTASGR